MIAVRIRTNLDLDRREIWPTELPAIPAVGDYIESSYLWQWREYDDKTNKWSSEARLQLKVYRVTWVVAQYHDPFVSVAMEPAKLNKWVPEIEVNIGNVSMRVFYEWYGKITRRGVHAFI